MKKVIPIFLFWVLAIASTRVQSVHSQANPPEILLLDRNSRAVTSMVDGNRVRLRIKLGAAAEVETKITFRFPDQAKPAADCTVLAGSDSCETALFPALGWYWGADGSAMPEREITAALQNQEIGSLNVSVTPRPVVMVHGYISDTTAWNAYLGPQGFLAELGLQGFAVGDGQVPGVMNTGSAAEPAQRTNSIAQNAGVLGEYIGRVQELTGAEKVDVLVHSMGGLIARYYIDRIMSTDNVAQLIILGTPMAGSACAILPASLGLTLPASLEIQPSYMVNVFNQQIVRRQGVPFHALAGTKLHEEVASPCTPVPSDVVVTLGSVKAIPMPVEEIPLLHTDLNKSHEVFTGFVTPLLKTAPDQFEVASDPPPGSNAPASQQFSKAYTGHVNPGETQDVIIPIDPNVTVANFALYDTSRSLSVAVTGASGRQLELDPVENGVIRVDDPSTMVYLGYGFKQPRPGRWVVTLQSSESTPPSGADFAIVAQFHGGALLQATQDITVPRLNETVTIRGTLTADGAAIPLANATAVIRQPDGSVETLEMTTSGNQAELKIAPDMSGIYGVEVNVLANSSDGNVIDRAAFLTFEAEPASTEIAAKQNIVLVIILLTVFLLIALLLGQWRKRTQSKEGT